MRTLHPTLPLFALCVLLTALPACRSTDKPTPDPTEPTAIGETYTTDLDTLVEVMPFTFDALHWGQMTVKKTSETVLAAKAILPNDREATIHAQTTGKNQVNVHITVGHFGKPELEADFHKALMTQLEKHKE